jgi:hypothetical protein
MTFNANDQAAMFQLQQQIHRNAASGHGGGGIAAAQLSQRDQLAMVSASGALICLKKARVTDIQRTTDSSPLPQYMLQQAEGLLPDALLNGDASCFPEVHHLFITHSASDAHFHLRALKHPEKIGSCLHRVGVLIRISHLSSWAVHADVLSGGRNSMDLAIGVCTLTDDEPG